MMKRIVVSVLALSFALLAKSAIAAPISFDCITGNSSTNCATGEGQLFADVLDLGSNSVGFKFYNTGPLDTSITDIYFHDEDDKLSFSSFTQSAGVSFSAGCTPSDPPGDNGFTLGFCADSNPPVQPNGVNPNEYLIANFMLNSGFDYSDVLNELSDGTLALAIHVQGFANGGSETFENNPPGPTNPPVPEPASVLLLGSGLLFVGRRVRRKMAATKQIS